MNTTPTQRAKTWEEAFDKKFLWDDSVGWDEMLWRFGMATVVGLMLVTVGRMQLVQQILKTSFATSSPPS